MLAAAPSNPVCHGAEISSDPRARSAVDSGPIRQRRCHVPDIQLSHSHRRDRAHPQRARPGSQHRPAGGAPRRCSTGRPRDRLRAAHHRHGRRARGRLDRHRLPLLPRPHRRAAEPRGAQRRAHDRPRARRTARPASHDLGRRAERRRSACSSSRSPKSRASHRCATATCSTCVRRPRSRPTRCSPARCSTCSPVDSG